MPDYLIKGNVYSIRALTDDNVYVGIPMGWLRSVGSIKL